LLIAGDFDAREPLPAEVVDRLQRDPRIHLLGYVEDMPPIYSAIDVLTLPSHHEGLGYVLIEAAAMEVPSVGTRIPGIVDAVKDGVTGTLVPPGDPVALAEAISKYLRDPSLRREHGRAGRQFVLRSFSQERVWESFYQEYLGLLRASSILDRLAPPAIPADRETIQ
jgi:glycosyltransferase involved in cell wall biosynthesis